MKDKATQGKHKKRYSKISTQKRLRLIKMVLDEGLTLTKVAKILHIKRPTAKVIIKRYKQNGTFFHKKTPNIRTRDTIASNQELKIEERSQQEVSIELPPQDPPKEEQPKQFSPLAHQEGKSHERLGYLMYYPPFPQYHGFM